MCKPTAEKVIEDTKAQICQCERQAKQEMSGTAIQFYPAWVLEDFYHRDTIESWIPRWVAAGESVKWVGAKRHFKTENGLVRLIALKTSPIWAALGKGVGGYGDATGSTVPPFSWGSGLSWLEVSIKKAVEYGLLASEREWLDRFPLSDGEKEIAAALERLGPKFKANLLRVLGG